MADNISVSTSGGTETIGADEISSVKYQRAKLIYGPDGTNSGDVQEASTTVKGPLPTAAYHATDYIMLAGLGLVPKFAVINLTATGTLVAAVAAKKIRVLAAVLTLECQTGDETYTFKSGAAGTALTGAFCDAAAAGAVIPISMPFNPVGWFETTSGVLLELSLAGTSPNAQGCISYIEV